MNNQYIKQLSTSKVANMINYVFPKYGQSIITERDDERSVFRVIHLDTDESLTITIDDYEGVVNKSFYRRGYIHSIQNCMESGEMIRFHAWMYNEYGDGYVNALANFLKQKYDES